MPATLRRRRPLRRRQLRERLACVAERGEQRGRVLHQLRVLRVHRVQLRRRARRLAPPAPV
jgi:hypothetical protein